MRKVPHVQGKSSLLMLALIETTAGRGLWGCEKSWTAQYLPGFDVFSTNDKGDVWKGLRPTSNWVRVNGPMYWPAVNSFAMIELYTLCKRLIDR